MSKLITKTYLAFAFLLIVFFLSIFFFLNKSNSIDSYLINFSDSFFKLEKLKLDGRKRSSKEKIMSSLSIKMNTPILNINIQELKQNILQVPWIKNAKVSRKFPNEIHIYIEEYKPSAIWQFRKEIIILDRDGYHIERIQNKDSHNNLLLVYGDEADLNLSEFIDALENFPSIRKRIGHVTFIGKRRWDLHFKEGVKIQLPMGNTYDVLLELDQHLKDYNLIEKGHKKIDLRIKGEISTDRIFKSNQ